VMAVFEHAQDREHLFTHALILLCYPVKVFSEVPQLRLGRVYPLVSHLHDSNDFGKVFLCGRGFLGGCVGSCSWAGLAHNRSDGREKVLTQWHIIVWFHGHILFDLDVIDCLENGQTMPNTGDTHFLELCVL
jgi:hypothetical protein